MKLLAIEAGSAVCSVALFEDGRLLAERWASAPQRQTETLAPLVQELLAAAQCEPLSLDAVACGVGPGSFSGLRSSLAFGTGLSLAQPALRLIAVSTLQAWAEAFAPAQAGRLRVLLDGRRGQAYGALYQWGQKGWQLVDEPALRDLADWRKDDQGEALVSDLDPGALPPPSAALALAVGRLALAAQAPALPWEPVYLRRSEAEILWDKLHPPKA